MTNQEIQNMLNLCNQRAYILNRTVYFPRKGDKIKLQSTRFQHDMKYIINDIEVASSYVQDSLYDATITSACVIEGNFYEANMIQSCQTTFNTPIEEQEKLTTQPKSFGRPRSFCCLEKEEIETIVAELQEAKDSADYYHIQSKYHIHGKTLQKICKLHNLPITKKNDKSYIRNREALSEDDEVELIQLFITMKSRGLNGKEMYDIIADDKLIHPSILKAIYKENEKFISKKVPFVEEAKKTYDELRRKSKYPNVKERVINDPEEIDMDQLQRLQNHFNG